MIIWKVVAIMTFPFLCLQTISCTILHKMNICSSFIIQLWTYKRYPISHSLTGQLWSTLYSCLVRERDMECVLCIILTPHSVHSIAVLWESEIWSVCCECCRQYYRQVSNIRCSLVGNKLGDHSDVVGEMSVGADPTCTKTLARRDKKQRSFGIWSTLY